MKKIQFILLLMPLFFWTQVHAVVLKHEEAELRARQVSKVSYVLSFKFKGDSKAFDNETKISFDVNKAAGGKEVFAELSDAQISSLTLNGKSLDVASAYDHDRIHLPFAKLKAVRNELRVVYTRAFVNNGNGLHRFQDVADGHVYIFNHFEAYYAHVAFPCFDQPDLKASFTIAAEAPRNWQVVASSPVKKEKVEGALKHWTFESSARISTYMLNVSAGDFHVWHARAGKLPLALYARESMVKYVEDAEIFEIMRHSVTYYEKEFSTPYPYGKLDLVLVPNFAAGAMENVAAVTANEEHFITRSTQPPSYYFWRADTLTHEIAHQWFGDLVTMKWWNGLWLNESFATVMASLAASGMPKFEDAAWTRFYLDSKRGAYLKDQLVTTHPIEVSVADTDEARSNFDAITYGKGASVLKQLRFYLTPEKFNAGLKSYFKKYKFSNTVIDDFMVQMSKASGEDLSGWQKEWLRTEGLNTVRAEWSCADGKMKDFKLFQTAPKDHPVLRTHHTRLGFIDWDEGHRKLVARADPAIAYSGAETTIMTTEPCPLIVFPNQDDEDYVKVSLDPVSMKTVRESLSSVDDRLTRLMLWESLWEAVRDANLAAMDYLDIVEKHLPGETDPDIIEAVANRLPVPMIRYTLPTKRSDVEKRIEKFLDRRLSVALARDESLIYFRAYLAAARSSSAEKKLAGWLKAGQPVHGVELTQDRRWQIIQALARLDHDNIKDLIAEELKHDPTDSGRKAGTLAEVQIPDSSSKLKWFERMTRSSSNPAENAMDAGDLRVSLRGFQNIDQPKLLRKFSKGYFEQLARLSGKEDNMYVQILAGSLFPLDCDDETIAMAGEFLSSHPGLYAGIKKSILESREEAEICRRVHQASKH